MSTRALLEKIDRTLDTRTLSEGAASDNAVTRGFEAMLRTLHTVQSTWISKYSGTERSLGAGIAALGGVILQAGAMADALGEGRAAAALRKVAAELNAAATKAGA